jgi:hypothetical protein
MSGQERSLSRESKEDPIATHLQRTRMNGAPAYLGHPAKLALHTSAKPKQFERRSESCHYGCEEGTD